MIADVVQPDVQIILLSGGRRGQERKRGQYSLDIRILPAIQDVPDSWTESRYPLPVAAGPSISFAML